MVILGGVIQVNPFYVPPDEFLRELTDGMPAPDSPELEGLWRGQQEELRALRSGVRDLTALSALPLNLGRQGAACGWPEIRTSFCQFTR